MIKSALMNEFDDTFAESSANILMRAFQAVSGFVSELRCALQGPGGF